MTQADTLGAIQRARFSCRSFRDDPVPRDVIAAALADAQHVASWCNLQPWQVQACGPEETGRLAKALFAHTELASHESDVQFSVAYDGEYKARRRDCGWQLYDAVGVEKGDRAGSAAQMRGNFRPFGAPNFLLISTPKALGSYGVLDCGAFVAGTLLALQARGGARLVRWPLLRGFHRSCEIGSVSLRIGMSCVVSPWDTRMRRTRPTAFAQTVQSLTRLSSGARPEKGTKFSA